jgi:N-acetylglucosamine-6-sulfatase
MQHTTSSRRNFMKTMTLGATAASVSTVSCAAAQARQPNILFVMSDDHTAQAIGAYGMRLAGLNPTPTIDRLAREGMLFNNTFCTNSICTPSRANIMTGQYSQTNGVLDLDGKLSPERHYLAIEMKKAGYQTAMVGKWHLKEEPAHFDYYKVLPGQGKYHDPSFREKGKGVWPNNTVDHTGHSSDNITDITLDWLKQRNPDQPFFLMHHYKAPHDMFENARRYDDYLEDVDIPEPDNLWDAGNHGSTATRGEDDSLRHYIGSSVSKRNTTRNMGMHMKVDENLPDEEYTREAYQRYLKRYLRCVKGVDDNMQRLFDYLESEGLMDNTVIIYTGDQGFMLGEHDYIDKRWMYEESMRMPLLIRYSKMIDAGSRCDLMINNCDFAPTMLELAGVATPAYMQGRSFAGALAGNTPTNWREATYYRYWMHMAHRHANPAHFGIRTKDYKLIFFYGMDYVEGGHKNWGKDSTPPGWEFYDLRKDPKEMDNRYGEPQYAEIIADMKNRLKTEREELNETEAAYPHLQRLVEEHWND